MVDLEKVKTQIEPIAIRLERYLEEVEVGEGWDKAQENRTYLHQRAKLQAYRDFLILLESSVVSFLDSRRIVVPVNEFQYTDKLTYQERMAGLSTEEKIKQIRKEIHVPGWENL